MNYLDFRMMAEHAALRKSGGSEGGKRRAASGSLQSLQRQRSEENAKLVAAGFEAMGGDLWRKDGCWYGREAALQELRNKHL